MARAYSADMRQRVIDRVESGASRREDQDRQGHQGERHWQGCTHDVRHGAVLTGMDADGDVESAWIVKSGIPAV
jgi:hypothetical protein